MSFVYDKEFVEMLKKTLEIGCLQPCVREKGTNRYLLGEHRKRAYPDWPEIEIEVKDDLHRELIIVDGNHHRQISEQETRIHLIHIAKILEDRGVTKNKICTEMTKLPIPFSEQQIRHLLPPEYKMVTKARPNHVESAKVPSQNLLQHQERMPDSPLIATEASYPFPECRCKECPRRTQCW
jgi:hypothetical protein